MSHAPQHRMTIIAIWHKTVEIADRFSNRGCNVGSYDARYRTNAVTNAHKRASVLRRDVHVINEVTAEDEAVHADSQYE